MANLSNRSIADVLQDIVGNLQQIIRAEIRLARTELKEEAAKVTNAGGVVLAGAVLGIYALGFLLLTIFEALQTVMAPWLASLVVAMAVGAAALVTVQIGRSRWSRVRLSPDQTIQSLKEITNEAKL